MSSEKSRIRELKRPDTFQKKAYALIEWGVEHKVQILLAFAPVVLAVAAYYGWQHFNAERSASRRTELASVDKIFSDEAEAAIKQQEEMQKKISDIDAKLKAKPEAGKPAVDAAALGAEKAKLETEFKGYKANHTASLEKFKEFYKKNLNNAEGWRAAITAVGILVDQEQFKEAAALLEEVLPHAESLDFYQTQARSMYVSLLEELGDYDKGLAELDKLLPKADDDLKPRFLLAKGRLQLLSGKKADAVATFDKIIGEYNTSMEAKKAKTYKVL